MALEELPKTKIRLCARENTSYKILVLLQKNGDIVMRKDHTRMRNGEIVHDITGKITLK